MRKDQQDHLQMLLEEFGLNTEQSNVYTELLNYGSNSALKLSKKLNTPRTQIYRILEQLIEIGLIIKADPSAKSYYSAQPVKNLERTLLNEELRLEYMRGAYAKLQDFIETNQLLPEVQGSLVELAGFDGLRRALWNAFNLNTQLSIMSANHTSLTKHIDASEDLQKLMSLSKVGVRVLTNDSHSSAFSHVRLLKLRHIEEQKLKIKQDVIIGKSSMTIIDYPKAQPSLVTIQNNTLIKLQQDIFNQFWNQSK